MRAIFLGTPELGRTVLEAMIAGGIEVPLVITQPDREHQRRGKGTGEPSAVGAWAAAHGLRVLKPDNVAEVRDEIDAVAADVSVVAAYGQLLPEDVLATVDGKWVNVHGSLLPKYRGASPVQQAILDGEAKTGVTIMEMVKELDAGAIISQRDVPIAPNDTAGSLMGKIAEIGSKLLVETLPKYLDGSIEATPQKDAASTMTHQLNKSDGQVDWSKDAGFLERFVRAMQPWPGATTSFEGQPVTILATKPLDVPADGDPGQFAETTPLVVATGDGSIEISQLKPAGKQAMSGEDWLRGLRRGGRFVSL